ncbi:STAS domain-containing protein [Paracoccus sp. DMF-8]|uniref:STAS domain-containing protein n=1 Tax=Paracoccus sp. DMF-8 TaxID=3019445 RepID=UPI0023E83E3F|nr:STAS domain-containing protein [Paracoccus sp. DMF-8]MDF3606734.1 STAS domain-containing protein [Paracoccus sp. DMF-8]
MKLKVVPLREYHLVEVEEPRLDAAIATAFKDRMREITPQAKGLVMLDLRNVNFMDSSGLGAVIAVLKSMPQGRKLELTGLTPNVERVFRLTRMDLVFDIRPNADGNAPQQPTQEGDKE